MWRLLSRALIVVMLTTFTASAFFLPSSRTAQAFSTLGSTTLSPLDSDADSYDDYVKVEQLVWYNGSSRLHTVSARLFDPLTNYTQNWNGYVTLDSSSMFLSSASGSWFTFILFLYTPTSTPRGDYTVTINLTVSGDTPVLGFKESKTYLYPKGSYSVALSTAMAHAESEPGSNANFQITAINNGNNPDTIFLSGSSELGWNVSFNPGSISLDASGSGIVMVTVSIPQGAQMETLDKEIVNGSSQRDWTKYSLLTLTTRVAMADLIILDNEVTFSVLAPSDGQEVRVSITVRNGGTKNATNVLVGLFEDGVRVGEQRVPMVQRGSQATIEMPWKARAGTHALEVVVDPNNELMELDENNNVVSKQVVVAAAGLPSGEDLLPIIIATVSAGALLSVFLFLWGRRKKAQIKERGVVGESAPPAQASETAGFVKVEPREGRPFEKVSISAPRVPAVLLEDILPLDFKHGKSYLIEEEKPSHMMRILVRLMQGEATALVVTRTNPRTLKAEYALQAARVLWLMDRSSPGIADVEVIPPSLERLMYTIETHIRERDRGIVAIDGVEYLVDNNNFNAVLRFIRRVVDLVSQSHIVLLVSVSPKALQERELKILERELEVLRFA